MAKNLEGEVESGSAVAEPVDNTIDGTEDFVKRLRDLCGDYDIACEEAAKKGGKVYIGCSFNFGFWKFSELVKRPSGVISTNVGKEPCYTSLDEANARRNDDGNPHGGYVVVDVASQKVVDLIDRNGTTRLPLDFVATTSWRELQVGCIGINEIYKAAKGKYVITSSHGVYNGGFWCKGVRPEAVVFPSERTADERKQKIEQKDRIDTCKVEELSKYLKNNDIIFANEGE